MPFCPNCGNECQEGSNFCSACGQRIEGKSDISKEPPQTSLLEENIIWEGKPSGLKARMKEQAHLNATTYILTNLRLIIRTGVISKREEQIELIRIKDLELIQGLKDRALGVGDVDIISTDEGDPRLKLVDVKNPGEVKDAIWKAVRAERQKHVRYIGNA
jgi:hypothetical protein